MRHLLKRYARQFTSTLYWLCWRVITSGLISAPLHKGNVNHAPQESIRDAHLPLQGLEPVGGEPLLSVTRGQCDARPTVTFPAARHHRPLAGTKLYCLVTEARVLTVEEA